MLNIERLQYILDAVNTEDVVYTKELAERFFRSESTIRRDMAILEREGYIKRVHGGAVQAMHSDTHDIPYHVRVADNVEIKRQIAQSAAGFVRNRMLLMMDTSTTTLSILPFLTQKDIRIVTNSVRLVMDSINIANAELYCVGGKFNPYTVGFESYNICNELSQWNADICFFSSRCVDLKYGCTDVDECESAIKQTMIRQSAKVIYLADSTKFGKHSPRRVCDLKDIDCIITNEDPGDEWKEQLLHHNVELIICKDTK